jgi:hypothetical protein
MSHLKDIDRLFNDRHFDYDAIVLCLRHAIVTTPNR